MIAGPRSADEAVAEHGACMATPWRRSGGRRRRRRRRASTSPRSSATARACARSCATARRCARSSRPTATATARCRARAPRSPAARAGWRSRTRCEARELREAGLRDVRVLVMGALSPLELEEALAADADVVVWNESYLEAVAARRRRARARQVRLRHGAARHARPGRGLARGGSRAADPRRATGGRDDALRDRRRAQGRRLLRRASSPTSRAGRATVKDEHPEVIVHAANSAATMREPKRSSTWCAAGSPIYGMDPFGARPGGAGARAGARAELLRRRGRSCAGRGRAPATGASSSPTATPTSACCRSATATAGGAGSPTTPTC